MTNPAESVKDTAKFFLDAGPNAGPVRKVVFLILSCGVVFCVLWYSGVIGPFTDSGRIEGRWIDAGRTTYEFCSNGTFHEEAPVLKTDGKWRFESGVLVLDA